MKRFNKMLVLFSLLLLLLSPIYLTGCGREGETGKKAFGDADTIELSYAFFAPANTFPAVQMEKWAEKVEKRTEGKVKVETFPGGTLLDEGNIYDGVLSGAADIGLGSPSYDPGRFPLLSGISLPVGFPSATVSSLVFYDLVKEFNPQELEEFKVLTAFTGEPGYIQSTEPVKNLEDLEGMELRAAGAGVPVLSALRAAPTGMPMPEVPEAIQTGVLDGVMTSREVLMDFNLAEMVDYVVDYPTVVVTFAAVMKEEKWEQLPPDVQETMDELGREMALFTGQYHDEENVEETMEWAVEKHDSEVISLPPEEKERWNERLEPLIDEWVEETEEKGLPGNNFLERLYQLRDEYAEKHD